MATKRVKFEFNPFELTNTEKPKGQARLRALDRIEDFVLEQVLLHVGESKSPVAKGAFQKKLSPEYRKKAGKSVANLELSGDLLDNLKVVRSGNKLTLQNDGDEAGKSDGHNNHSGKSKLPAREFIPKEEGTFKRAILRGIKEIIEDESGEI